VRVVCCGVVIALLVTCLAASFGSSQPGLLQAIAQPSGAIILGRDNRGFGFIDLNAHGPEWTYATQRQATCTATPTPEGGSVLAGEMPVLNSGGAVRFTETVTPRDKGVDIECNLGFGGEMTLNGLQLSLLLPCERWVGKEIIVRIPPEPAKPADEARAAEAKPEPKEQTVTLPQDLEPKWQLYMGRADQVRLDPGPDSEFVLEAPEGADLQILDLRQFKSTHFEVRFALIYELNGRKLTPDDHFALKLRLTAPSGVSFARAE
jgi:hypothetical protein